MFHDVHVWGENSESRQIVVMDLHHVLKTPDNSSGFMTLGALTLVSFNFNFTV